MCCFSYADSFAELQQEIDKESSRYIRHSLRLSSPSSGSSSASSSSSPSSKLMAIPGKISTAYAEIEELSNQKQEIAQRLVSLIEQTRTRLDIELGKVRALQGEPLEFPGMPKPLVGVSSGIDTMKMPALAMTESLKAALAGTPISDTRYSSPSLPATPVAAAPAVPSHKRTWICLATSGVRLIPSVGRKVTASASTPSIKVPASAWAQKRSASPTVQPSISAAGNPRSRLSRQIHPPTPNDDEDEQMEAGEQEEVDEDDRAYCYCQKSSFGDVSPILLPSVGPPDSPVDGCLRRAGLSL